jgi:hypothetical protein
MVRMNDNALRTLEARLREQITASCAADTIPGFVAGVCHAGDEILVAHGTANVTTGAPMREDCWTSTSRWRRPCRNSRWPRRVRRRRSWSGTRSRTRTALIPWPVVSGNAG